MDRAACFVCGRPTYDAARGERPWVRAVAAGRVALVCPLCQVDHPEWRARVAHCPSCDSVRLSITLGDLVCRECGTTRPAAEPA